MQQPARPISRKSNPFRLLVWLLYGTYDWIALSEAGLVTFRTGPCAKVLHVTNSRLHDYIQDLQTKDFLRVVTRGHGFYTVRLTKPKNVPIAVEPVPADIIELAQKLSNYVQS